MKIELINIEEIREYVFKEDGILYENERQLIDHYKMLISEGKGLDKHK